MTKTQKESSPPLHSKKPDLFVVGGALIQGERCLVAQRSEQMILAQHWEFPGGKLEPGERDADALKRELDEELNIVVEVGPYLGIGTDPHNHPTHTIVLKVYEVSLQTGTPTPKEHGALRWVTAAEIDSLKWAPADQPVLPLLKQRLEKGI
ncbi:MAG: (deoxy)nucleoside triphosphate pyrophosphohydrolase [Polyangiaceae bacterium]|nr:(deoxy)nucleoside triphosphate pyrophosphohydrolase [Polyangiaceae bacterium]